MKHHGTVGKLGVFLGALLFIVVGLAQRANQGGLVRHGDIYSDGGREESGSAADLPKTMSSFSPAKNASKSPTGKRTTVFSW